ncbi:MAG: hypothetical protein E7313_08015 [Clostridiales bacterium]|nr:hypothetical protein [Clostridiales bacterium]
MIRTLYEYTPKNYFTNETIYSTLFSETKPKFWFASRSVTHYTLSGSPCDFGVFFANGEDLLAADYNLYNSAGGIKSHSGRCVPVVSLEPNIQIKGQVNGVWQLDV